MPDPTRLLCAQPGCAGTIDDGYCDVCGLAPAAPDPAEPAPAPAAPAIPPPPASHARPPPPAEPARTGPLIARHAAPRALPGRSKRRLSRPELPPQDPLEALVPGEVPPHRRFCSSCEAQLEQDRGFCPRCGQEFSFIPTLRPGDLIAGRYEIKGALAFGGLGWIYLALDVVLGRWVTLKGLLNAHDPKLLEVAVQEREYLAALKHPSIVSIHDFLQHGREGFIVMEYVNGRSLTAIRKALPGPMPPAEALAYIHEALPALDYLHERGLIYCDFKPDNVMIEGDQLRLIDLGAVRRADDTGGDIYGSRGYSAPEAGEHPTLRSDLYSVGRALAVLTMNFDFQGKYEHQLPPADEHEALRAHPPFAALLRRATAADPARRFASAAEMAEQVEGVLRLVGGASGRGPSTSPLFDLGALALDPERTPPLPPLRVDEADEGAGVVQAGLALGDPARRRDFFLRALRMHPRSAELKLRLADEHLALKATGEAEKRLAEIDPADLRPRWYQGKRHLLGGDLPRAVEVFSALTDELPGELGPLLALAWAREASGDLPGAAALYARVAHADPSLGAAFFGESRCLLARNDRKGAAASLQKIPASSQHHALARLKLARLWLDGEPGVDDVLAAAEVLESLEGRVDDSSLAPLRAEALASAARQAARGEVRGGVVLGVAFDERALRLAAERAYRRCAARAADPELRALFIDEANAIRPWSLFLRPRSRNVLRGGWPWVALPGGALGEAHGVSTSEGPRLPSRSWGGCGGLGVRREYERGGNAPPSRSWGGQGAAGACRRPPSGPPTPPSPPPVVH